MKIKEIKAKNLDTDKFIAEKVLEIREAVGSGSAINALSGGVDSSVVTALGHRALGKNLKTYMIDNGIMRQGEPAKVAAMFKKLGIHVEVIKAQKAFFDAFSPGRGDEQLLPLPKCRCGKSVEIRMHFG